MNSPACQLIHFPGTPPGFLLLALIPAFLLDSPAVVAQQNVTFNDFKFEMEKGEKFEKEMITEEIKKFVGQKIKIRGYILPTTQNELKNFILVRDNNECCFGPRAALYDCMVVRMQDGATAKYTIRPIAVEGEFRIRILPGPGDRPLAVYEILATNVK